MAPFMMEMLAIVGRSGLRHIYLAPSMIRTILFTALIIGVYHQCLACDVIIKHTNAVEQLLLCHDLVRWIPDLPTKDFLGFKDREPRVVSPEEFAKYTVGPPLPSLDGNSPKTPDDITALHLKKLTVLQNSNPNIIKNITCIGEYWNPSIVLWRGHKLMTYRTDNAHFTLALMNENFTEIVRNIYPPPIESTGTGLPLEEMDNLGQDVRTFVTSNDTIVLTYTAINVIPYRIAYLELAIDDSTWEYRVVRRTVFVRGSFDHFKNWGAFELRNRVYFINTIAPDFHVVERYDDMRVYLNLSMYQGDGNEMQQVSLTSNSVDVPYQYGDIHGGTPAQPIGNGLYFALFHSRIPIVNNYLTTYFFGAYIFDEKMILRKISAAPIVHERFYTGEWMFKRHVDYCIFPMSYVFLNPFPERYGECDRDCLGKQDIMVSAGFQDRFGYTFNLNLLEVIDTLVPVTSSEENRAEHETHYLNDGDVIRLEGEEKVFFVQHNFIHFLPDNKALDLMGKTFKNVIVVSDEIFRSMTRGPDLEDKMLQEFLQSKKSQEEPSPSARLRAKRRLRRAS